MKISRRAFLIPAVAAVLLQAAPADARAQQADAIARHAITREVREAAREVARAVTRYQGNRDRFQQSEQQRKSIRIAPGGILELHNIAGDITIGTTSGDQAMIEITKIARGPSEADAREQLRLVQVEILERPGGGIVRTAYPERRGPGQRRNFNVSTAYRVTAPAGTRIKTDSVSGNIAVTGIRGELALGTISGNVLVRDAGRRVNAQSISGNVDLISAQDDALVEMSSTSGNVRAQGVKVRRLDLSSVSGSVIGRDLQCEQARLHTTSGNVEYSGGLTSGGRYEFGSHSGDVRLAVAPGVGFEIEASSYSGEVRSGLQLRVDSGSTERRRQRRVRGTYGDGRARIEATSFSGNVLITGR